MKKRIIIGEHYPTTKWGNIEVMKQTQSGHNTRYLVRFEDGTVVDTSCGSIGRGQVRNPNQPTLYGVGCIGQGKHVFSNGGVETPHGRLWHGMMGRAYCAKTPHNTRVCKRWHNFQNFCKDVSKLSGYGLWENTSDKRKVQLDKDELCAKLGIFPKIYSPNTCQFISGYKNNSQSHITGKEYWGISPSGEQHTFHNQTNFGKQFSLDQSEICKCISGKSLAHKGWTFGVVEEEEV